MVTFGDPDRGEVPRAYTIANVPGHACDNPLPGRDRQLCGWRPHDDWGDGSARGGLTWRKAWSQHTRAFLEAHPRCTRCTQAWATESHHFVYRSRGGSDAWENLRPRCKTCHDLDHAEGGKDETEGLGLAA